MSTQASIHINHARNLPHVSANKSAAARNLDALAVTTSWHRGKAIYSQGEPAENWYRVLSGTARCYAVRPDGRRQIVDLLLPGDYFGFETHSEHDFTVEAVVEGIRVVRFPRRRLEEIADSDPPVAREIRRVAIEAISRLQAQLFILGRITALKKVSSFLLELWSRLPETSKDRIALPISRYDIADYLTLSVETVSRSLTDLKQRGVIALQGTRQVRILDRDALEEVERRHNGGA